MTDVSDGLLADLGHIATASGVAHRPVRGGTAAPTSTRCSRGRRGAGVDPWSLVLGGGEDHALVGDVSRAGCRDGWRAIGTVRRRRRRGSWWTARQWAGPAGWQSFD